MVGSLTSMVDGLVGTDISDLSDAAVRLEFIELRREIDRLECYAARLLAGAHGRGIPAGDGASSTAAWAQSQTGQRCSEAKASLAAGQACESLPGTAKAWAQGEISASVARTIGRGQRAGHEDAYASIEETLVDYAASRDLRGLDLMIRHYQTRCDALDDTQPEDKNGLFVSSVGNRWALQGDLDALGGATINVAVDAATDKPGDDDPRTASQRRAAALVRICRFYLDHAPLPVEDGERPHVTLSVQLETLLAGELETCGELALSPAQIARLLCDAQITPIVVDAEGNPLDVGATVYRPSRKLRRAVMFRDQHCRYPGCDRRHGEVHHVTTFPAGPTVLANLVFLCDYHHHVLHKPGWTATFDGTTLIVTNPDGRVIGTG